MREFTYRTARYSKLVAILRLMRPLQWLKNGFVAAPLFFAGQLFVPEALLETLGGVVAFSLVASCLYILNDWRDREADRQHPKKRHRPLASGTVSPGEALLLVATLLTVVAAIFAWFQPSIAFGCVLAVYAAITTSYIIGLKHVPLLELFIVASGYVLRVIAGGLLIDVELSPWILAASGLIALLIVSAKRRADITKGYENDKFRKSLTGYSTHYLDHVIAIAAGASILTYILFTVSPYAIGKFHTPYLIGTSVFVCYGVLRYLQLVIVGEGTDDPTTLVVKDKSLAVCLVLWITSFFLIIYFPVVPS